jgi:hypothetical protein
LYSVPGARLEGWPQPMIAKSKKKKTRGINESSPTQTKENLSQYIYIGSLLAAAAIEQMVGWMRYYVGSLQK